ncbi:Universal stress protein UspA [Microbacterium sp. C448]|uniref:universal stress protein n=1 Tax=Microbacterium TaxID=33882 RepID=UPI0003DE70BD|nr:MULTISPECIES: universal stress protein [Microbacterium]CDK00556.1 Universal stress protein UspA [Microbacterium sp. C448]
MSAPVFVVGYTATDSGADAAALAARLATASGGQVELVTVLLDEGRGAVVPPDASYDAYVREQAAGWLDSAVAALPAGLAHATHVRYSDSFAEGLLEVATELGAAYIVVGASPGGILGRYTLGAVANELLHSSTVPVVLAPAGARTVTAPLTRITAAVGTRPGADALIDDAVSLAAATGATLRLVSLVTIDLPSGVDTGVIRLAGSTHADMVLSQARAGLPADIVAEASAAQGASIEDAVAELDWQDGEVVLVGSSRLAQPRRLFLGSTAAKMLRTLPVPMIVVPRTHAVEGERA